MDEPVEFELPESTPAVVRAHLQQTAARLEAAQAEIRRLRALLAVKPEGVEGYVAKIQDLAREKEAVADQLTAARLALAQARAKLDTLQS